MAGDALTLIQTHIFKILLAEPSLNLVVSKPSSFISAKLFIIGTKNLCFNKTNVAEHTAFAYIYSKTSYCKLLKEDHKLNVRRACCKCF